MLTCWISWEMGYTLGSNFGSSWRDSAHRAAETDRAASCSTKLKQLAQDCGFLDSAGPFEGNGTATTMHSG